MLPRYFLRVSAGVVFLILAHLFVATPVSDSTKAVVLAMTFGGTLGDLLAPWAVRYGAAWCAWITLASWAAQGAGIAVSIALSVWACVRPGRAESTV